MARQFEHPILISSCVVNVIALTSISTVSRGFASAAGLEQSGDGFWARVNTSHHQSIRDIGRGLRVASKAPDGVIEAVEHELHERNETPKHWVVGVQWHPERMPDDPFAQKLFTDFVHAARKARLQTAQRP